MTEAAKLRRVRELAQRWEIKTVAHASFDALDRRKPLDADFVNSEYNCLIRDGEVHFLSGKRTRHPWEAEHGDSARWYEVFHDVVHVLLMREGCDLQADEVLSGQLALEVILVGHFLPELNWELASELSLWNLTDWESGGQDTTISSLEWARRSLESLRQLPVLGDKLAVPISFDGIETHVYEDVDRALEAFARRVRVPLVPCADFSEIQEEIRKTGQLPIPFTGGRLDTMIHRDRVYYLKGHGRTHWYSLLHDIVHVLLVRAGADLEDDEVESGHAALEVLIVQQWLPHRRDAHVLELREWGWDVKHDSMYAFLLDSFQAVLAYGDKLRVRCIAFCLAHDTADVYTFR